ncbi:E3 ubiquitin-protein ligase RGLG3 [Aegilops tauschii subsp. strangulata]|nr:E3 ubiquitin-protein ligase RGLG3 [Aegilops tauschii subsp. strangulata]XP_045089877.1 E3 ubiquitin-protein ligase RGLG3 [Aegilops tauschii subsp. strangulata]
MWGWGKQEKAHDTKSSPGMWGWGEEEDEEEEAHDEHATRSWPITWGEEEETDDEEDTRSPPTSWDENTDDEDVPSGSSEDVPSGSSEDVPSGSSDDVPSWSSEEVPSGSSEEGEPMYNYSTVDEVITALREAGLESSNLIFGIDFTKSNDWSGQHSFGGESLHAISRTPNPYEQAISIIGRTLSPFDDDNLIPCFGFGDVSTCDHSVFSFYEDYRPCCGFEEVLDRYKQMIPYLDLSGPTSFAPLIYAAISVVENSNYQHHVLVIIADGQVATSKSYSIVSPQEEATIQALIDASFYPLSIVMVGVGDGPWKEMQPADECIPARAFYNFQFVNFTDIMSTSKDMAKKEAAFAFAALMEIPTQYKAAQGLYPPEWHEEMADPWMILPPPIEVLERDDAVAATYAPAATFLPTDVGNDASVEQVCPICLRNPRDMAFQCGHLTCRECGPTLSTCPVCRVPITHEALLVKRVRPSEAEDLPFHPIWYE